MRDGTSYRSEEITVVPSAAAGAAKGTPGRQVRRRRRGEAWDQTDGPVPPERRDVMKECDRGGGISTSHAAGPQ